jgi:hypothetical protein
MPSLDIAPPTPTGPPLRCGQPVHVNVRTSWLPAVITWLTPGRVGVAYQSGPSTGLGSVTTPWTSARPPARGWSRPAAW